jgi:hypothetical protein
MKNAALRSNTEISNNHMSITKPDKDSRHNDFLVREAIEATLSTAASAILSILKSKSEGFLRAEWGGFQCSVLQKRILKPAMEQLTTEDFDYNLHVVHFLCDDIFEGNLTGATDLLTDDLTRIDDNDSKIRSLQWMLEQAQTIAETDGDNDPTPVEMLALDLALIINILINCSREIRRLKALNV